MLSPIAPPPSFFAPLILSSPNLPSFVRIESRRRVNWYGTVCGRLCYAVDKALFYVTGGFAYGGGNKGASASYVVDSTPGDSALYSSSKSSHLGWTLGGG